MGFLIFLLLVIFPFAMSTHTNVKQKAHSFQCEPKSSIYKIKSVFDRNTKDRLYSYYCRSTPAVGTSCSWYSNANYYGGFLLFQCTDNRVITGVTAHHSFPNKDRRFQFRCCSLASSRSKLTNCRFSSSSGYYGSTQTFSLTYKRSYLMKGALSTFSSTYRDRKWRYEYCSVS